MLGILIARAILDKRMLDLPLNKTFWDVALNRNVSFEDIKSMQPVLYK